MTPELTRETILAWLRETDPARLADLWQWADRTRQECVGGEVHLRGLIEISNYCVRLCGYCGLRAVNEELKRYRMTAAEILACAHQAVEFGYGTVVLQSGEDRGLSTDFIAELVCRIKAETPLAVTLSLGERDEAELAAWREAGADRYLLRFETGNQRLYERIHPPRPGGPVNRLGILRRLQELGYEVGSGVMIGIPGQSYADLADDVIRFRTMELDMIGVGPYIYHPNTPLADPDTRPRIADEEQVPNNELMTYKLVALTRLVCPRVNIPATTALATLNTQSGRELGLVRGANVIMPNLTPPQYRVLYEIYPSKACIAETADQCGRCIHARIAAIGRSAGLGTVPAPNFRARSAL